MECSRRRAVPLCSAMTQPAVHHRRGGERHEPATHHQDSAAYSVVLEARRRGPLAAAEASSSSLQTVRARPPLPIGLHALTACEHGDVEGKLFSFECDWETGD